MEIITTTPSQLRQTDIDDIANLAGIGFGRQNTPEMRADSISHIQSSDAMQLAYENRNLVAFSMMKRRLWR